MAMKKWNPPPPEAAAAFAASTRDVRELEPRKMFGYDAVFLNGNMVAGLHEAGMVLRLPDADRERFLAEHQAKRFEVMGRLMREYVVVPAALFEDNTTLTRWLRRSASYVSTLPDKSKPGAKPVVKKKAAGKKEAAKTKTAAPKATVPRRPAPKKASKAARPNAAPRKSVPPKIAPGRKRGG